MLSALLVALREGVEAALVVGIVLVYLNRTGRAALAKYAWTGVALAVAASIAAAVALQHWRVSEDGFEGVLMLVAAALVVTMIVWMNRVARHLKREIEDRVEAYAQRSTRAAGWGVGAFVFMMVVREGAELVLILRAVELSTAGVQVWIGTALGIAIAVAVGLFFFQGTLRIPLHRFFAATSVILMVVAFQLALTGVHELSEADWIWSSKTEMATIGPIVRNEVFFFVVILGAAALVVLREWFSAQAPRGRCGAESRGAPHARVGIPPPAPLEFRGGHSVHPGGAVAGRRICLRARDQRAGAGQRCSSPQNNQVRIPLGDLQDSSVHFYTADVNGTVIRFLVIHRSNGDYATALDACQICGTAGYRQEGQNVVCRNCGATIYIPSIGESGGCNPIPVKSRVEAGEVIVDLSALASAMSTIHP